MNDLDNLIGVLYVWKMPFIGSCNKFYIFIICKYGDIKMMYFFNFNREFVKVGIYDELVEAKIT